MTFPEYQHRFRDEKLFVAKGYPSTAIIRVDANLHYLKGNDRPYFSVTGEVYRQRPYTDHNWDMGGQITKEILQYWPELKPIIDLHLSDDHGVPLHAEANGWYQLAGYFGGAGERYHAGNGERQHWKEDGTFDGYRPSTPEECLRAFAEHARVTEEGAQKLADLLIGINTFEVLGVRLDVRWNAVHELFRQWIDTQKPRWQQEAKDGIELLDRLIAKKGKTE